MWLVLHVVSRLLCWRSRSAALVLFVLRSCGVDGVKRWPRAGGGALLLVDWTVGGRRSWLRVDMMVVVTAACSGLWAVVLR